MLIALHSVRADRVYNFPTDFKYKLFTISREQVMRNPNMQKLRLRQDSRAGTFSGAQFRFTVSLN